MTSTDYLRAGWSIIPIRTGDKRPAIPWAEFQKRHATEAEAASWAGQNVGIVTGEISGIDVVDFDTAEAFELAKQKGLPSGPLVKTAKGWHLYCRHRPGLRNFQKRADLPGIDLRAEGGYVVAPPSRHPSGAVYEWITPLTTPLPEIPEWLLATKPAEKQPLSELYTGTEPGERNNALARLVGSWCRDGGDPKEILEQAILWNKANPVQLPAAEVRATVKSILDTHRRNSKPAQGEPGAAVLKCASTVVARAIQWLWGNWLARGKLHILAGAGGTAKTTLLLFLLAIITSGRRWPDDTEGPEPANVLIWSGEDGADDTLVPRLMAAGADLSRVFFIEATRAADGSSRPFDPASDIQTLIPAIREHRPAAMMVDSIVSAVAGDSHKNAETRRGLQPLVDLAEQFNVAVIGVTHFTKSTGGKDPVERVTASLAFTALARVVMVAAKLPPGNPHGADRILALAKSNIGPDTGAFGYDVEMVNVAPGIEASRVAWQGAINGTAKELLAEPTENRQHGGEAMADATDFLQHYLAQGPQPVKEILDAAQAAGIAEKTLRRAKSLLAIEAHKDGVKGGWQWEKPQDGQDSTTILMTTFEDGQGILSGHLGESVGHLRQPSTKAARSKRKLAAVLNTTEPAGNLAELT